MTALPVRRAHVPFRAVAPVVVVGWLAAWFANLPLANWVGLRPAGPRARIACRRRRRVLPARRPEGPAPAPRDHDRGLLPAQLLPARADARRARRPRHAPGDRRGGRVRDRHAVLLVLGGAALHRLRGGRDPARGHLRLPDQQPDGQRGRARPAVGPLRPRDRAPLHGRRAHGRGRRRAGPRPPAARAVDRAVGPRRPGRGRRDVARPPALGRAAPARRLDVHQGPRPQGPALRDHRDRDRRASSTASSRPSWSPRSAGARTRSRSRSWWPSRSRSTRTRPARSRSSRRCWARACRSGPPSPS